MDHSPTTLSQPTERRRATIDLCVVLSVFLAASLTVPFVNPILRRGHGLSLALLAAAYQFTIEGLAPLALIWWRGETAIEFGLRRQQLVRSLTLAIVLAGLYDLGMSFAASTPLWIPLARQPATRMSIAAGFPGEVVGLAATIFVWGAMEGFFGVYFARKFALATATRTTGWIAPGVLAFALFNGLVHLIVGQGLTGFIESFASGYAIAVIPAVTNNSWGGLLVQTLTNAVGGMCGGARC